MSISATAQTFDRAAPLGNFAAGLIYISDAGHDRLTGTQLAFFVLAAFADLRGTPATRSDIMANVDVGPNRSLANSYRVFLEPGRVYPDALGWLTTEPDPNDARRRFLRLTERGHQVAMGLKIVMAGEVRLG